MAGTWYLGEPASRVTHTGLQPSGDASRLKTLTSSMDGGMLVAQAWEEAQCARVPASPQLGYPGRWQQGCITARQCMGTCLVPRPWNNLQ